MECATSMFQCFPSSGSLGRSVVFEGAGAKSQVRRFPIQLKSVLDRFIYVYIVFFSWPV